MRKTAVNFKIARRCVWVILVLLFVYILLGSHDEQTLAEIMSEVDGETAYLQLLWSNLYALLPFVILFVMAASCAVILCSLWRVLTPKMREAMTCLSEFILAASIWVLTDSYLLSFITAKVSTVALISYLSFTAMAAFLLEFMSVLIGRRKSFDFLCIYFYAFAFLELCCFLIPFVPVQYLITPVHIGCLVGAALVICYGFREAGLRRRAEILRIVKGFIWMIVLVLIALLLFYLGVSTWYSLVYSLGICIFCAYLMIAALNVVKHQIEHEANESAYRKMAYTDSMTGLKNKAAYMEEEKKPLAIGTIYLMMDINGLKQINDACGHRAGDDVIMTAAHYIQKYFGNDLCYRFGGDEFIVICHDLTQDEAIETVERMRAEMKRDNRDRRVPVELAVGHSVCETGDTVEDMFQRADKSMYDDKALQKAFQMN